jgi:hypothetical protein
MHANVRRTSWLSTTTPSTCTRGMSLAMDETGSTYISKIHFAPVRVREMTFVEKLEKQVPDFTMRLFEFIQQNHLIRSAPDTLGKCPAFFVSNIARRCSNQSGHSVLFTVFTHVDTGHGIWVIKNEFGQSLCRLCLSII